MHPTYVSENNSSSGIVIIFTKILRVLNAFQIVLFVRNMYKNIVEIHIYLQKNLSSVCVFKELTENPDEFNFKTMRIEDFT